MRHSTRTGRRGQGVPRLVRKRAVRLRSVGLGATLEPTAPARRAYTVERRTTRRRATTRQVAMQLRDIMRTRVVTIDPDETASSAWTRMRRRGIRHLVVTDGTDVVGIISERDLG